MKSKEETQKRIDGFMMAITVLAGISLMIGIILIASIILIYGKAI